MLCFIFRFVILSLFVFANPIIQSSDDPKNHVNLYFQSLDGLGDQSGSDSEQSNQNLNLKNPNKIQILSLLPRQNSESVCPVTRSGRETKTPTSQQSEEQQPNADEESEDQQSNANEVRQDETQNPCDQYGEMDKILTCTGPEVLTGKLLTVANCVPGKFSNTKLKPLMLISYFSCQASGILYQSAEDS